MTHADALIAGHDLVDLGPAGANARQVRGGLQAGLIHQARERCMRALAGAAAGAIGDGDKTRVQRRKTLD
jgi:hypothetical protein